MAEAGIVRDFRGELLDLLLENMDESSTEQTSGNTPGSMQTGAGAAAEAETQIAVQETAGALLELIDANNASGPELEEIWEKVDAIDIGYEGQLEALRDYMYTYMNAVLDLSAMIDVNRLKNGLGLADTEGNFKSVLAEMRVGLAEKKDAYDTARIHYALDKAGVPEEKRAEAIEALTGYGYTMDEIIGLCTAVNTDADKLAVAALISGEYNFGDDPNAYSPGIVNAISNHSAILYRSGYNEELANFVNTFTMNVNGDAWLLSILSYTQMNTQVLNGGLYTALMEGNLTQEQFAELEEQYGLYATMLTFWSQMYLMKTDANSVVNGNSVWGDMNATHSNSFRVDSLNFNDGGITTTLTLMIGANYDGIGFRQTECTFGFPPRPAAVTIATHLLDTPGQMQAATLLQKIGEQQDAMDAIWVAGLDAVVGALCTLDPLAALAYGAFKVVGGGLASAGAGKAGLVKALDLTGGANAIATGFANFLEVCAKWQALQADMDETEKEAWISMFGNGSGLNVITNPGVGNTSAMVLDGWLNYSTLAKIELWKADGIGNAVEDQELIDHLQTTVYDSMVNEGGMNAAVDFVLYGAGGKNGNPDIQFENFTNEELLAAVHSVNAKCGEDILHAFQGHTVDWREGGLAI